MPTQHPTTHLEKLVLEQAAWTRRFRISSYVCIAISIVALFVVPGNFKVPCTLLLLAVSRFFVLLSTETIRRGQRLESSLAAETDTYNMLRKGLPNDWSVDANVDVPRCGDVDVFVVSPTRKYYAVEVKSHGGEVMFDGVDLNRGRRGAFEKDFLTQVTRAAKELQKIRGLPNIHPILVFTRARLNFSQRQIRDVTVLRVADLLSFLISEESNSLRKSSNQFKPKEERLRLTMDEEDT